MSRMKFLFINPKREIEKKNIWSVINSRTPPLGLAVLSAVLEQEGHQTDIVDAAALDLDIPDILSRIPPDVDFAGLTATTPEITSATRIARAIRERFPRLKIIFGGVHPTVFHREMVRDGVCDIVVRGEGERPVLALARQQPPGSIANLTWRTEGGEVKINPQSDQYVDLDGLPLPAYHKLSMEKYHSALGAAIRSPSLGMITSRGCPGACTFCFSGMFGSKVRFMSSGKILEHILAVQSRYGIREISFYDDTFTANRKRVEELCRLLISRKIDITWSCFARVDTVEPGLLALMKKAGCHQICYGFESADESILKAVNKKINAAKVAHAVEWTRKAGIDIRGAFMLGNPGETAESLRRTVAYAKQLGIQFAMFNITTPFPGTALFDWAVENGFLRHRDWDLYDLAHVVLELPTVPSETVRQFYYRSYREFYLRPFYMLKRLLSLRTVEEMLTYVKVFFGILSLLTARKTKGHA
jgi:radical SAM superfamily enzyme YgiQ (UPF0313 family)